MRVAFCWAPDETAALARMGMVRDFPKFSFVNVAFAALRAVKDHRDGVACVKLAGF
jgi:hypothetical protein|tara:strand:- start:505 stop:672 length:168 start_codon:yes stop_codon:yes gene_type:complete